jgi:two-component system phosphate regulon sensor histidine kinase PhoR
LRLGFQRKLFLTSLVLVLAVIAAAGVFVSRSLERQNAVRTEEELGRHAAAARLALEGLAAMPEGAAADALADSLGAATGTRLTIIAADGRVLGDSDLTAAEVETVEAHGNRPEVREALAGRTGSARRYSTTLAADMLYLAAPFERPDARGAVRVARSLASIDEELARLYGMLALAGLLGLGLAAGIAWISSRRFSRALERLVEYTRRMAEGSGREPFSEDRQDEFGGIAGSVYRLAQQLEDQVETLARERDRFEAVLDGMSEAVIALDREGRVHVVNRAGIRLLGLGEQPAGRTLLETIRVPELHALATRLEPGGDDTAEFDLPTPDAPRVLARGARRRSGETVLVLLDVTELRRLETVRRDFVANVSHELRTPVAVIRANAETLAGGAIDDPPAARRFLASMVASAERLSRLIADLLDISRIESGTLELDFRPVPVGEAFGRARTAMAERAAARSIALTVVDVPDLAVRADPRALDQVLSNLVDNAVKYTPEGGHVRLGARRTDGRVRLEVSDDGPGVEPRHRERLFERFYRVDPGRSREMGGTGLGLAIVKHLVTAMGGSVHMVPAPERGSIFRVELDAAGPNGDPAVDIPD